MGITGGTAFFFDFIRGNMWIIDLEVCHSTCRPLVLTCKCDFRSSQRDVHLRLCICSTATHVWEESKKEHQVWIEFIFFVIPNLCFSLPWAFDFINNDSLIIHSVLPDQRFEVIQQSGRHIHRSTWGRQLHDMQSSSTSPHWEDSTTFFLIWCSLGPFHMCS